MIQVTPGRAGREAERPGPPSAYFFLFKSAAAHWLILSPQPYFQRLYLSLFSSPKTIPGTVGRNMRTVPIRDESWEQEAGQGVRGEALYEGRRTERRVDGTGWNRFHGFTEGSGSRECAASGLHEALRKGEGEPKVGRTE